MRFYSIVFMLAFTFSTLLCVSQESDVDADLMLEMSLEELMNIDVSVASKNAVSNIRETPGVISIISRRDIEMSGAYDLLGVLQRLVPGVAFGADVEGVVGVGMRGLWSHEGKVLLMIDGKSVNDEQFATTQFGNHINADIIEKIEIIRGPGSSIYGGYASLGVINVITRTFKNNAMAAFSGGYVNKSYSHQNVVASAGVERGDFKFNVNTAYNRGFRSNKLHHDFNGFDTSFLNTNAVNSMFLSAQLEYQNLTLSYMVDKYETTTLDLWGTHSSVAFDEKWDTYAFHADYDFAIGKFKIIPYVKYKYQLPWNTTMVAEEYTNSKHASKLTGGLVSSYNVNEYFNATIGAESYQHDLMLPEQIGLFEETYRNDKDVMRIKSISAFGEITIKTQWVNIMAGMRYDAFDKFENSFLPRLAVTKVLNNFHVKGMLSGSFRTPGGIIPNRTLVIGDQIKPETVWSYELEGGYKIGDHSWFSVNGFYHDLRQVIVYQTDGAVGFYGNGGRVGTLGLESTYRFVVHGLNLNVNYAFYAPSGDNDNMYRMPDKAGYYIGFAKHRANVNASLKVVDDAFFNLTGRLYGYRYGIVGDNLVEKLNPLTMTDFNLRVKNLLTKGLNASIGVDNIFDYDFVYYQAYDGGHAGIPSFGRTLVIKADYSF